MLLLFLFSCSGIYVGEGKVIHFTHVSNLSISSHSNSSCSPPADLDIPLCGCIPRRSGVILSCLDCFVGDGSLSRYAYGVNLIGLCARVRSGTCTTMESDPPEDVIHRAEYLLETQMFALYDVLRNNCEDFALYCKTGRMVFNIEGSGGSAQASSAVNVPKAALLCLVLLRFVPGPGIVAAALANRAYDNYTTDIGVRDDAFNVEVEVLVDINRFRRNAACRNAACPRHKRYRVQQGRWLQLNICNECAITYVDSGS